MESRTDFCCADAEVEVKARARASSALGMGWLPVDVRQRHEAAMRPFATLLGRPTRGAQVGGAAAGRGVPGWCACARARPLNPRRDLPQHEGEDAAVAEVLDLHGRVDAQRDGDLLLAAVGAPHDERQLLARGERTVGAEQVVALRPVEPELLGGGAVLELAGEDTHPDQVRAVDALEGAGDDGAYAEEAGTLGGPVARAAGAVLLSGQDDERHA